MADKTAMEQRSEAQGVPVTVESVSVALAALRAFWEEHDAILRAAGVAIAPRPGKLDDDDVDEGGMPPDLHEYDHL